MTITSVRGTQDQLDLSLHNEVARRIKDCLQHHNYEEIITPVLEHTQLFLHAVGQETDIVSKEMYTFERGGEQSICLRPEATASIMRAYGEHGEQRRPWKVFLYGPMFRYERPQKGRWREFWQWSIELIGVQAVAYDAQFLKMLDTLFANSLGIDPYALKLNFLGCASDRQEHRAQLKSFLDAHADAICKTCTVRAQKNMLRVFDCKEEACTQLYTTAPRITDHLCSDCGKEWQQLRDLLEMLSVSFVIDHKLVRGLDYYCKTVFEFVSTNLGAQSAFCGGGRYIINDTHGLGVGIGMGRLLMLLEQQKTIEPVQLPLVAVVPFSAQQHALALVIANTLPSTVAVEVMLEESSLTNMLKKANKLGARYVLLLGQDEQVNGTVAVKDMLAGTSQTVKQTEVAALLKSKS